MTEALVTVPEAAAILGVSYQEADRLVRAGTLAVVDRVGVSRRLRRADVERRRQANPGPGRPPMSQPPAGGA